MRKLSTMIGMFLVVMLAVTGCSTMRSSTKMEEPVAEMDKMDEMATKSEPVLGDSASHSYGVAEFPESLGVPSVEVELFQDPGSGWNVHVNTENFTFSPEHAGLEHYPGEGHVHLYVDGVKIARMYGPWFHFDETLDVGDHEVEVTLNSNDHNLYLYDGEVLEAKTVLTVESE